MNNIADDISHAYQDGFNNGVRSVFSKAGFFLVKDEKVYAVDIPYNFKYQKSVDMLTGEVHYPTNRMWLRGMTDEELAKFFHDMIQDCGCNNVPCQQFCKAARNCELAWLNWLKKEARTND